MEKMAVLSKLDFVVGGKKPNDLWNPILWFLLKLSPADHIHPPTPTPPATAYEFTIFFK